MKIGSINSDVLASAGIQDQLPSNQLPLQQDLNYTLGVEEQPEPLMKATDVIEQVTPNLAGLGVAAPQLQGGEQPNQYGLEDPQAFLREQEQLLAQRRQIAEPVTSAEGEMFQPSRPTGFNAIQQQRARTQQFRPTKMQDLLYGNNDEGALKEINARRKTFESLTDPTTRKMPQYGGRSTLQKGPIKDTEYGDLTSYANQLAINFNRYNRNTELQDDDGNYNGQYFAWTMPLIAQQLGGDVDPFHLGMALSVASVSDLGRIDYFNMTDQQKKELVEDPATLLLKEVDPKEARKGEEIKQLATAKSDAYSDEETKIESYKIIEGLANSIGKRAMTMLGFPVKDDETSKQLYPILGEMALQNAIDNGLVNLYKMETHAGRQKYYPAINIDDDGGQYNMVQAANAIAELTDPNSSLSQLMALTPTQPGYTPGPESKRRDFVLSDAFGQDGAKTFRAIQGGVAHEVDVALLGMLKQMLSYSSNNVPFFQEHFKLHDLNRAAIKGEQRATLTAQYMNAEGVTRKEDLKPQILEKIENEAEKFTQNIITQNTRKANKDLTHLDQLINPDKEANPVHYLNAGKPRFIDVGQSERNLRFIDVSRDGQHEAKATIRQALVFKEKAYNKKVKFDKTTALNMANKFAKIQMMVGLPAFNAVQAIDNNTLMEMTRMAMWSRLYLKLFEDGPNGTGLELHEYVNSDQVAPPDMKKMSAADHMKYYANNKAIIDDQLTRVAAVTREYEKDPSKIPMDPKESALSPKTFEAIFERGELSYAITTLRDVANWTMAREGQSYQMQGILELDQNNSNLFIQALKGGAMGALSTLGYNLDGDLDSYFDSETSASFYTEIDNDILGKEGAIISTFQDADKRDALRQAYKRIKEMTSPKDAVRHILVAGSYGLHPSVNGQPVVKQLSTLLSESPVEYDALIKAFGSEAEAKDGLKQMYGATYNRVLATFSLQKLVQPSAQVIAIRGDYAPTLNSDTLGRLHTAVGVSQPSADLRHIAIDEASDGMLHPQVRTVRSVDQDGNSYPVTQVQDRIDYVSTRDRVDDNGNLIVADKYSGMGYAQSLLALLTHATDSALLQTAVLTANQGRNTSLPVWTIHDALKLNAASYLKASIAYNQVAIPAIAADMSVYEQVVDQAYDTFKYLHGVADKAKADKKMIAIGIGPHTRYRALYGNLDYYADLVAQYDEDDNKDLPNNIREYRRNQYKERLYLLERAHELGWKPKVGIGLERHSKKFDLTHSEKDRDFHSVHPDNFRHLVSLVYELVGFPQDTTGRGLKLAGDVHKRLNKLRFRHGQFKRNTRNANRLSSNNLI